MLLRYNCVNRLRVTLDKRDEADLRVGEHLLDGVNGATGDSGPFEASQPVSGGFLREPEGERTHCASIQDAEGEEKVSKAKAQKKHYENKKAVSSCIQSKLYRFDS